MKTIREKFDSIMYALLAVSPLFVAVPIIYAVYQVAKV
jgi:hypothetical protein